VGTVSKALGLLDFLKDPNASYGLTDIAKLSGFDKATTRRLLLELVANGFVEQDEISRDYLLGPSLQMLGRAREERFPLYKTAYPIVKQLSEVTGETVHATEYSAGVLISICTEQSDKANRVILTTGQKLPLHATASGMAFLAASAPAFVEGVLRKPMDAFTKTTQIDRDALLLSVNDTKARGYSISNQSFEDGVHSVAAAIIDNRGKPIGTIAIAMPTTRATPTNIEANGPLVRQAAQNISIRLFGKPVPFRKAS
jgi:DNA-binding IclR family transcriptional regulator